MDPDDLYAEGDRLCWEGDPGSALPLLLEAAESGHVDAMFRLGRLHDDAGRRLSAIRWHRAAAERGHARAMIDLALLIQRDDRRAAMEWTARAVHEGDDLTAHLNYGVFLEEAGRTDEAERYYRIAAEAPFPAARNRLACLLRKSGRAREAEAWFRRVLDERADSCDDPGDDDHAANTAVMYNLAGLLEETGRRAEALDLYRQAAERGDAGAGGEVARLTRRH
jgi:TPR repeat protein